MLRNDFESINTLFFDTNSAIARPNGDDRVAKLGFRNAKNGGMAQIGIMHDDFFTGQQLQFVRFRLNANKKLVMLHVFQHKPMRLIHDQFSHSRLSAISLNCIARVTALVLSGVIRDTCS